MNFHGKAGECRSVAVYRDHAVGVRRPGDGVFGVGGNGTREIRVTLNCFEEFVRIYFLLLLPFGFSCYRANSPSDR